MARVEVLPIEKGATPDQNNLNKHTQKGGGLLENSLRKRGAFRSIASAGKGVETPVVYAGNYTLEKAIDAGFTEVVNVHVTGNQLVNVVRDDIAPGSAEAIALGIEDNEIGKQSYNPDIDLLAQLAAADGGILAETRKQDKVFNDLLQGMGLKEESVDAEPQTDRAAELLEKWQVKTGDLWQIGGHRLLCGDSTKRGDVERVMSGEKAGMMFTDPPYNINMKPASVARHLPDIENDNMSDDEFELFLSSFLEKAREVVDGSVYVCCDWRKYHIFFLCLEKVGWGVKNLIVWNKSVRAQNLNKWAFIHEFICYNGFMGAPTLGENVWTVKREFSDVHLTPKPVELVGKAIMAESGDVYDPFGGSGTTMVACNNLGRKCRMIEIDPKYAAVILERMGVAFPDLEIKRIQ